ncbi:MAG TPA: hypothetical protein VEC57_06230 [Candidatus Limnocylindrales bacterium]|nr:hypothetical protein [Candidatus Limnocylindrales bacterium]
MPVNLPTPDREVIHAVPPDPHSRWRATATAALLVVGLLQMAADLAGRPSLHAVAAATVASPAPKVFSPLRGLETFSTRFFIEWLDGSGNERSLELTPEVYERIQGPYNRRNVFGAALAHGPVLVSDPRTRRMFAWVSNYAMCEPPAVLLWEFGIAEGASKVRVRLVPREGSRHDPALPLVLSAPCKR